MNLNEDLKRSILRSQKAYQLYLENKRYHQALRIFKANEIVYRLLQEFLFDCDESLLEEVFNYIFHLEDWFESFKFLEKAGHSLEDTFVFPRLDDSPGFPRYFIENVLIKRL